jgi:putative ABC transport system permease protein
MDDLTVELAHHRDQLAARLEREGWTADDARREATRRVGNVTALRDAGYDVRGGGVVEAVLQDLRYAFRWLRRSPAFTLTAIITLALGIGANTAIFSVAYGVLLRPLPYPDADRLAMIWMDNTRLGLREDWHSYPSYADYREGNTTFAELAIFNNTSRTLTGDGDPERLIGAHGSASLFEVLGTRPLRGRTFTAEEDRPGANNVVVLSYRLWQRRYGGREDIVGRSIQMSGRTMQVIGVMPEAFAFPSRDTAFWVPTGANDQQRGSRGSLWLQMIGRLRPGVTVAQAQAEFERLNAEEVAQFPQQRGYGVHIRDYHDQLVGRVRPAIRVLLGAVACVLLIACTNVANLLLARASTRERELALRAAIGAGRTRLVRQLLTESTVIGLAGGLVGVALAWAGLSALIAVAPSDLPRLDAIAIDWRVLAATAALSIATGFLFGLAPAVQLSRTDPGQTMKEGARGSSALGRTLRRGLVVAEVALAVVLLVGAGLMLRSFDRLQQVDLGFNPDRLLTARLALWGQRYSEAPAVINFFDQVVTKAKALPGVEGVAGTGTVFLSATPNSTNFSIEGRPEFAPEARVEVPVDSITPDYFRVMEVPLERGRFFDSRDTATSEPVVIINATMARMFWPNDDAIGRRIKYGQLASRAPWMTIVGVVDDTRRTGYDAPVRPETYLPHAQSPDAGLLLVVRTSGDPMAVAPALQGVVRAIDPGIAVQGARPIESVLVEMTAQRRLNTILLTGFALVAAVLAAVGIYGVMAYSVEQRSRELGVRIALGASPSGILRLIMREALTLSTVGLAIGLLAAFALSASMTALLYDVRATDPATFAVIAVVALATAAAASLVPAIRALRLDPALTVKD